MARKSFYRNSKNNHMQVESQTQDEKLRTITPTESRCTCNHSSVTSLELPRDRLAISVRKCREASGKSIYRLAEDSGVEGSTIWRIEQGERKELTRETLLLLSLGLVLDGRQVEQVIEAANEILDAAGLKMLRAPWESKCK